MSLSPAEISKAIRSILRNALKLIRWKSMSVSERLEVLADIGDGVATLVEDALDDDDV